MNCRRDGIEDVAYIGMFGNDGKAEHLKWALTQENVHFERSRIDVRAQRFAGGSPHRRRPQVCGRPARYRAARRPHPPDPGGSGLHRAVWPVPHELLLLDRV
ncbi:MAG: hypothetical protein ACLVB5_11080 [Christensenellales bacterium]